jgi:class 3 adenylate cyclase
MEKFSRTDIAIVKRIKGSQQPVTVLFTDIEDSTGLWGEVGDVNARLMVDRLNRLLFPVIKRFHGKVIKTIGDSIMAAFREPGDAVYAAIAMQQMVERERARKVDFPIKIRIGVHSGQALVEADDIFGDVVNTASWIESVARGDEILVSVQTAADLFDEAYHLKSFGSHSPKGKSGKVELYTCLWRESDSMINDIYRTRLLSVLRNQKLEIFIYFAVCAVLCLFLYFNYLRFLIADHRLASIWLLDPLLLPQHTLILSSILLVCGVAIGVIIYRLKRIPLTLFRLLKGTSLAALTLFLYYGLVQVADWQQVKYWNEALYTSKHLFVEVVNDHTPIREKPDPSADILLYADRGDLLLQNNFQQVSDMIWNRVLIGRNAYGWVERAVPIEKEGKEHRLTYSDKFYFCFHDLYGFLLMIPAFIWGFLRFRMRPV